MGDHTAAAESRRLAVTILEALSAADPGNAELPVQAAPEYAALGDALFELGDTTGAIENHRKALSVLETAASAKGTSVDTQATLAASYAQSGALYARLGSRETFSESVRLEHWRKARSLYARSLELVTTMRKSGSTPPENAPAVEHVARQLEICDQALARLQVSRVPA
jgi:tetratricopeptide (TPR) repeat protein